MKRPYCQHCQRALSRCLCHTIVKVANRWPIVIAQHPQEAGHALGTAIIAKLSLQHCQLQQLERNTEAALRGADNSSPLLLYPGADSRAVELYRDQPPRPIIVLDASWRKSRRMLAESPYWASLPRIALDSGAPSRYRIRRQPRAGHLSTLEAIVALLATLEGDAQKYLPLLRSMDWMIAQQIQAMGSETFARNYPAPASADYQPLREAATMRADHEPEL